MISDKPSSNYTVHQVQMIVCASSSVSLYFSTCSSWKSSSLASYFTFTHFFSQIAAEPYMALACCTWIYDQVPICASIGNFLWSFSSWVWWRPLFASAVRFAFNGRPEIRCRRGQNNTRLWAEWGRWVACAAAIQPTARVIQFIDLRCYPPCFS